MVTWKIALAVIIIAILLMFIGIWLGYRYVREQNDISPEARLAPPSESHGFGNGSCTLQLNTIKNKISG